MKFHVLIDGDDGKEFIEVDGELVDVGYDIKAFVTDWTYSKDGYEMWRVVDVATGARLSDIHGTKDEAISIAASRLECTGLNCHKRRQEHFRILYGSPPALEIEVIKEPETYSGELSTCQRW